MSFTASHRKDGPVVLLHQSVGICQGVCFRFFREYLLTVNVKDK